MGVSPPGLRLRLHQPDPAQPRARLLLGGHRRRHRAGPRPWSRAAPTLLDDAAALALANRIEGHPDNVAPALLGGLRDQRPGRRRGLGAAVPGRPVDLRGRVRAAARRTHRGGARAAPRRPFRTPTPPPTPVARRCSSRRSAATPSTCSGPPRTSCTSSSASRRCRSRSPWSPSLRGQRVPAVVSGAGPTVLAFVTEDAERPSLDSLRPDGGRCARRSVGAAPPC